MQSLESRVKRKLGNILRVFWIETRKKKKKYRTRVYEKCGSVQCPLTVYIWHSEDEARLAHELILKACEDRGSPKHWPQLALERVQELQFRLDRESRLRRGLERSKPF